MPRVLKYVFVLIGTLVASMLIWYSLMDGAVKLNAWLTSERLFINEYKKSSKDNGTYMEKRFADTWNNANNEWGNK